MKYLKIFLLIVVASIMSAGTTLFFYAKQYQPTEARSSRSFMQAPPVRYVSQTISGDPVDLTSAAELSVNAVVHVMTTYENNNASATDVDPFFEFFFRDRRGIQPQSPRKGSGSGVIISSDGYIVTNNHVVENSDAITVTLNDKRTFTATLVGADASTDLALLKIDATGLPTLAIGNSDDLKVGEWVLAVGNPFNLTSTVTAGIVSAKARNINILNGDMKIESFIQTDAVVNPGNSGGALVNMRGELVGINTAIASNTGTYSGYSFAVPVSIMSKVVSDLKEFGVVQRALLGIVINDIDADFAKEKNIDVLDGVYVTDVAKGSAAMDAGIQKGDIIIMANNVKVKFVSELQEQISRFSPGDKVTIRILRGKGTKDVIVTLKNKMGDTALLSLTEVKDLGVNFTPLSNEQRSKYGISSGLQVEKIEKGGKFAAAGIPEGYIIVKMNNRPVNNISDIEDILSAIRANKNKQEMVLFLSGIKPDGRVAFYAVDIS